MDLKKNSAGTMNSDISQKKDGIELTGVSASRGYALGSAKMYQVKEFDIQSSTIKKEEVLDHINEFKKARDETAEELQALKNETDNEQASAIISAQIEMVNDPELANRVEHLIKDELYSVDYAIQKAFESYIELIRNSKNSSARERSVDITDTRNRLLQIVKEHTDIFAVEEGAVIVANSLSPREVIQLMKHNISGIVMDCGGATSHTAIIARALGIPAIVGAKGATDSIKEGDAVIMDGNSGRLVVHPSDEILARFEQRMEREKRKEEKLYEIVEQDSLTHDGQTFTLRANIEFVEELERVRKVKAEGIGLLRSESIYLEKEDFENVRQQEYFYSTILEDLDKDPVIIRLFDAGGDKIFKGKQEEQNPFLGWRGIRMLLDERDLLRDQLRAILSAAGCYPGRVRILVPMVTMLDEVIELKKEIKGIQAALKKEGRDIDEDVPLGIMVEVPGVALQIEDFLDSVDFLSIGTNDLTQYVLAVDRGNELIADMYDQRHPAVWRLIRRIAGAGNNYNKQVTVCGELASDPTAAAALLGMGIRDLSMSPARLPYVKKVLINRDFSDMEQLANRVTACKSSEEVHKLFNNWSKQ